MADPVSGTVQNITPFGQRGSYESDRAIIDSVDNDGGGAEVKQPKVEPKELEEPTLLDDDTEVEEKDNEDAEGTGDGDEGEDGQEESEFETEEGEEESSDGNDEELQVGSLYQRLKKANSKLLKEFPELKDVIFSEEKYREVFPTVELANHASEKSKVFDHMESQLMSGDSETLINSLAETNRDAALDFIHNFLPTVHKMSKEAYMEVLYPPMKRALQNAYANGKRTNNKNLEYAAEYLNQFLFDDEPITKAVEDRKKPEKSEAERRLEQERNEFYSRQAISFRGDVEQIIIHRLDNDIKNSLTELKLDSYKQKNLVRDIRNEVDRIVASDKRYMSSNESLMTQAKSAGYTSDWKARISNSYLARAKAALSVAKRKVLVDARIIKGDTKPQAKRVVPSSSTSNSSSSQHVDPRKVDWRKTSDADILNDRPITYKK